MQIDVTAFFSWVLLFSIAAFVLCEMVWLVRRLVVPRVGNSRLFIHDALWSLIPALVLILLTFMGAPMKKLVGLAGTPVISSPSSHSPYGK